MAQIARCLKPFTKSIDLLDTRFVVSDEQVFFRRQIFPDRRATAARLSISESRRLESDWSSSVRENPEFDPVEDRRVASVTVGSPVPSNPSLQKTSLQKRKNPLRHVPQRVLLILTSCLVEVAGQPQCSSSKDSSRYRCSGSSGHDRCRPPGSTRRDAGTVLASQIV